MEAFSATFAQTLRPLRLSSPSITTQVSQRRLSVLATAATLFLMITESMKRILPIAIASLVFSVGWGEWLAASRGQTGDPIQSIRQQYAAINKRAARYKKVKKELSGFSTEGGELVAYFDGPAIVKIVASYYGESGRADEEYYYRDGKLIFVYRKDSNYDRPLSGKVVKTKENRFYFQNDRLIKWINENGKEVAPGEEYQKQQDEYLATSNKFLIAARSTDPTIEAGEWVPTSRGWPLP